VAYSMELWYYGFGWSLNWLVTYLLSHNIYSSISHLGFCKLLGSTEHHWGSTRNCRII
jgi:hypothetical protein